MAKMKLKSRVKINGHKAVERQRAAKPAPDFVYYIQIAATPEKDLLTEILIPV